MAPILADPGATDLGKLTIAPGEQDFSQTTLLGCWRLCLGQE